MIDPQGIFEEITAPATALCHITGDLMARYGSFLYRRNGIYYARLRVPRDLQVAFGKTHLRASLGTTNSSLAPFRVHETVLRWKRVFDAIKRTVDPQVVVAGSPLLLGPGSLTIDSAARESGLTDAELVREALNRHVELRASAWDWLGSEMPADELEFDFDGSFIVNSADGLPQEFISGELFLRQVDLAAAVNSGTYKGCRLYRDAQRRRAVVFQLPGVSVPAADLLIQKADAESIRSDLAARVTPEMRQPSIGAQHRHHHRRRHRYRLLRLTSTRPCERASWLRTSWRRRSQAGPLPRSYRWKACARLL